MTDYRRRAELSPAAAAHLSRLLDRWAATRRLDESQRDAICRAIVSSPNELSLRWWDALLQQVTISVAAVRESLATAQNGLSTAILLSREQGKTGFPPVEASGTYRLYLKLT